MTGDDFTFLRGLAQGLVLAYAGCNGNDDNLRYVALTNVGALEGAGVLISDDSLIQPDGQLVLAAVTVLASTDQRSA
ncbi:hypothetical protein [Stenotrophomonas sp.]|uniref:hypothetical protein n=1 Tax=Stenotrophomonas sp. TaxID=69392 RepID=UPI0028B21F57|nr:hypothetical protein [Stenotrophomonas sp.]